LIGAAHSSDLAKQLRRFGSDQVLLQAHMRSGYRFEETTKTQQNNCGMATTLAVICMAKGSRSVLTVLGPGLMLDGVKAARQAPLKMHEFKISGD